jgi:type IV secretion system protein VirB3
MAAPDPREAREDTLHIGATRPAMFWGLPMPLAVVLLAAAYLIQTTVTSWQGALWAGAFLVPTWLAARLAVSRSPYGISVLAAWVFASGTLMDRATWGGASRAPLPARQPGRTRGMRHVV